MRIKALVINLLFLTVSVKATNYYVSTSGNNTQAGTQSKPWKTINHAVSKVAAGDTVFVQAGDYAEAININKVGTSSAKIVFMGLGSPKLGTGANNIQLTGQHIVFNGFDVRNTSTNGISISGSNIEVRNCNVYGNTGSGIIILTSTNVSIFGGKAYNNDVGITLGGKATNLLIDGVDIYSTGVTTGIQEAGIKCWNGGGTKNFTMRNLKVHDHPAYGAEIMPSSSAYMTDVFMTDCHFYYNGIGKPASIPGITFRAANVLIQRVINGTLERNIFERGMGWGVDIYTSRNYKVFNNLFINNFDTQTNPVGPGFALEVNASTETLVYNNTFYGNQTSILISYIDSGHDWPPGQFNVTLRNNLVYKSSKRDYREILGTFASQTKVTMDNNVLSKTGIQTVDPQFVNIGAKDFHLKPTSPFIDKGVTVPVPEDYDGVKRPQGASYDMGMYEFCSSSCGGAKGPNGYKYSIDEQGIVPYAGVPLDIAYGQDGDYVYLMNQKQNVSCNNTSFGSDPKPGVQKYCFIKESNVPYSGFPIAIPGTLELENFDFGGQGVSYNDTETANQGNLFRKESGVDIVPGISGFATGFNNNGEWQKFTINVAKTADYDFKFFAGAPEIGGKIKLTLGNTIIASSITVPKSTGWGDYQSFTSRINLPAGKHALKIEIANAGFNLDKIEISESVVASLESNEISFSLYPNPSSEGIYHLSEVLDYEIFDLQGHLVSKDKGDLIDLSNNPSGIYVLKIGSENVKLLK